MSHHGHVQLVVLQSEVNAGPLKPSGCGPGFGGISPDGGGRVACGCEVGLVMGSDAAGVHPAPRTANSAAQDSQRALLVNRVIFSPPEEFGDTSLAPSEQEWSGQMAGFDESAGRSTLVQCQAGAERGGGSDRWTGTSRSFGTAHQSPAARWTTLSASWCRGGCTPDGHPRDVGPRWPSGLTPGSSPSDTPSPSRNPGAAAASSQANCFSRTFSPFGPVARHRAPNIPPGSC